MSRRPALCSRRPGPAGRGVHGRSTSLRSGAQRVHGVVGERGSWAGAGSLSTRSTGHQVDRGARSTGGPCAGHPGPPRFARHPAVTTTARSEGGAGPGQRVREVGPEERGATTPDEHGPEAPPQRSARAKRVPNPPPERRRAAGWYGVRRHPPTTRSGTPAVSSPSTPAAAPVGSLRGRSRAEGGHVDRASRGGLETLPLATPGQPGSRCARGALTWAYARGSHQVGFTRV